ncbi:MAG: hypothetical protein IJ133_03975 [Clostridia bacterium]|nr:hypothetical protein [Clostridia bacterium]
MAKFKEWIPFTVVCLLALLGIILLARNTHAIVSDTIPTGTPSVTYESTTTIAPEDGAEEDDDDDAPATRRQPKRNRVVYYEEEEETVPATLARTTRYSSSSSSGTRREIPLERPDSTSAAPTTTHAPTPNQFLRRALRFPEEQS